MQSGSKQLLSNLLCYRIDTATGQGLHLPGPARARFAHVAQCVPYIQHELQRTLTSQNILLEDTLSQALLSQKHTTCWQPTTEEQHLICSKARAL